MTILILDDHPLVRRGIIDVLSLCNDNAIIQEANTIGEGMDIMKEYKVNIALVDINLGRENGFDFIEKSRKQWNKTKYIVLTSSSAMGDFKKAKELEVDGYILKDSFIEDIIYALGVIKRGGKFFSTAFVENTMNGFETMELNKLTEREKEVFMQLSKGYSNAQIAQNLYISEGTTKKHISNILSKLELSNRIEVILYADQVLKK